MPSVPPGKLSWNETRTVLSFNPTERLGVKTTYTVTVGPGLRGAHGGATAKERTVSFTTIASPSVAGTSPADGAKDGGRFGVSVQFATPMDPTTLEGKIRISGFTAADLEGVIAPLPSRKAARSCPPRLTPPQSSAAGRLLP